MGSSRTSGDGGHCGSIPRCLQVNGSGNISGVSVKILRNFNNACDSHNAEFRVICRPKTFPMHEGEACLHFWGVPLRSAPAKPDLLPGLAQPHLSCHHVRPHLPLSQTLTQPEIVLYILGTKQYRGVWIDWYSLSYSGLFPSILKTPHITHRLNLQPGTIRPPPAVRHPRLRNLSMAAHL